MKEKISRFTLDAFPLVVLFSHQKGWEFAKQKLDEVFNSDEQTLMSSVNLGEVYYSILRDRGQDAANHVLHYIENSQIEIIFPTMEQTIQAAKFKSGGGLSYADCYAAALALEHGISVITGDREFEIVERQGVKIEWLPKNR